jgi:peptidoglycan/xylan/chitin deacetylase (PgdA/CDA1 family)
MKSIWLMYHEIYATYPDPQIPRTARMYHISKSAFSEHLSVIEASGKPVACAGQNLPNSVCITFDDGWAGAFKIALPMLVERGWKATFFITRDFVNRKGFCDRDMIIEAARQGMTIGVHGTTHRILSACSREEIIYEWSACKDFLESLIGRTIEYASLPGGDLSDEIITCAKECGLKSIATSIPGIQCADADPFRIKRIPVRETTSLANIQRYCNFRVGPERFRWTLYQLPKRLIGMRNYTRIRRRLMDSRVANQKEVFKP